MQNAIDYCKFLYRETWDDYFWDWFCWEFIPWSLYGCSWLYDQPGPRVQDTQVPEIFASSILKPRPPPELEADTAKGYDYDYDTPRSIRSSIYNY
jgi:hypothetical protein